MSKKEKLPRCGGEQESRSGVQSQVDVWTCPGSLVDSSQVACRVVCQGDIHSGSCLDDKLPQTEERGLFFDEEITKTHVSLVFPKVLWKWTVVSLKANENAFLHTFPAAYHHFRIDQGCCLGLSWTAIHLEHHLCKLLMNRLHRLCFTASFLPYYADRFTSLGAEMIWLFLFA